MPSKYEQERDATIARNKALLAQLMQDVAFKPTESTKRKAVEDSTPRKKRTKEITEPTRRSARAQGLDAEDAGELPDEDDAPRPARRKATTVKPSTPREPKPLPKGKINSKIFGHQPHVQVGKTWPGRRGPHDAGVHAGLVRGIAGNAYEGTWSLALSGGYPEDVDTGMAFTYTGCGGRELSGTDDAPKNLRTAPQTQDQTFDNPLNAALKKSVETGKPIRVLRGFKCPSPWAPASGYQYSGLYTCVKAWMTTSPESGFQVCRYALVRVPGQPPLPIQPGREAEAATLLAQSGATAASEELTGPEVATPGLSSPGSDRSDNSSEVESAADDETDVQENKIDTTEVESPTRRLRPRIKA